ncbi:MAG: nitroreductase/quinone reductase family protein [Pseudomonadales bacterium]
MTVVDRCLLRLSHGRWCSAIGSQIGRHTLLLTCRGAQSGQLRQVPLLFARDEANIVLLASRAGTDRHPHWYYNLIAHSDCQVTIAGRTSAYIAQEVTETERTRLWQLALQINPAYDAYAELTNRVIPVLQLRPTD